MEAVAHVHVHVGETWGPFANLSAFAFAFAFACAFVFALKLAFAFAFALKAPLPFSLLTTPLASNT